MKRQKIDSLLTLLHNLLEIPTSLLAMATAAPIGGVADLDGGGGAVAIDDDVNEQRRESGEQEEEERENGG